MKFVLVGAGNVATHVGPRLLDCGHEVCTVFSRTADSAERLAVRLGARPVTSLGELPSDCNVCLVMLTDSVLPELAPQIVRSCGPDTIYLHTAGSVPVNVWKDAGALSYGVLYPMVSFSRDGSVEWSSVPLFVEASDSRTMSAVRALAGQLSPQVMELDSAGRKSLHLAAVFANNFSNRMYAVSQMLLQEQGVPFSVMLPLIREAVRKLEGMQPSDAQTGPAVRGDRKVVQEHMEMLSGHPEWRELYRLISIDINNNLK